MIVQPFASRLVVARESGSRSEDPWTIGGRAVAESSVALSFPSGGGGSGKQRDARNTVIVKTVWGNAGGMSTQDSYVEV